MLEKHYCDATVSALHVRKNSRIDQPTPPFSILPFLCRSVFLTSLWVCGKFLSHICFWIFLNLLLSHANGDHWWSWMVCCTFHFWHGSISATAALLPSPHQCSYHCARRTPTPTTVATAITIWWSLLPPNFLTLPLNYHHPRKSIA